MRARAAADVTHVLLACVRILSLPCALRLRRCRGDADMRKAMPRDVLRKSVVPLKRPIHPHELECD